MKKVTAETEARIWELSGQGMSVRAIARQLKEEGVSIGKSTVGTYVKGFASPPVQHSDFERIKAERDRLREELADLQKRYAALESSLSEVIEPDQGKIRFQGWNINRSGDGYYRAVRRVGKSIKTVYLGADYDTEKARAKIIAKNKALGLGGD